ncbi:MAG: iron-sulfur cluster assembly accessory protein [Chloroflexi bacterium]|nr:MAG: iron-sulfur cluster assembly accessory protein [Chloroflexota bacterium]
MTTEIELSSLVTVTPKAAARAKELLASKGMPNGSLRVFVVGGGCSGYQYGMALAEEAEADDTVVAIEGLSILIDPDSAGLIGGAEVDYVEDLMKSGFTIYNPNATASCSCGSSFSAAGGTPRPCGH